MEGIKIPTTFLIIEIISNKPQNTFNFFDKIKYHKPAGVEISLTFLIKTDNYSSILIELSFFKLVLN